MKEILKREVEEEAIERKPAKWYLEYYYVWFYLHLYDKLNANNIIFTFKKIRKLFNISIIICFPTYIFFSELV